MKVPTKAQSSTSGSDSAAPAAKLIASETHPTYKAVLKKFQVKSSDVQWFFEQVPALLQFPWEIVLAYQFVRLEVGFHRTIRGGVVRRHRANSEVADSIIESWHMGFDDFLKLYQNVFGEPLPDPTRKRLEVARRIRNRTLHGKRVEATDFREAIVDVLACAEEINDHVYLKAQFKPFGSMQGYKGAASEQLPKETTRWLLQGLAAGLRKNSDDD